MTADRKKLYIISGSTFAALLLTLFAPGGSGRIIAASLLLPAAAISYFFIKKRSAPSLFKNQVLMIVALTGLVYLTLYFMSGFKFGFTKTGYGLKPDIIFRLTLPIAAIIFSSEVIRYVVCAQGSKVANVLTYFICLVGDIIICSTISEIHTFVTFMDVVGLTLFPSIVSNLLYNYLTKRYGIFPSLAYRAITVLPFYLIPYGSAISDSLLAFINLLLPIGIFIFIDALFEKKRKFALGNTNRFARVASGILTAVVLVLMTGTVMLISNQFKYGALVIATDSMTGEINKGDTVIFQKYDGETITVGQVIAFEKNRSVFVHRVVKIEIINGEHRFYTKGDANEDTDSGYVTVGQIVGLVDTKIPYIGYPTLWLRELFSQK